MARAKITAKTETAKILQAYRIKHNMLLYDMAKELNISSAELSTYENEKKAMPYDVKNKIKALYGIELGNKSNEYGLETMLSLFEENQVGLIKQFKAAIQIIKSQENKIKSLKRKNAHWIEKGYACGESEYRCSNCGETEWRTNISRFKYCPFCGAKMNGTE